MKYPTPIGLTFLFALAFFSLTACDTATGPDGDDSGSNPLAKIRLLSADFVNTVLTEDGNLFSWGSGVSGALGQGDMEDRSSPTQVPGLKGVIHYAQNGGMAFALTEDGSVYQWGHYLLSSVSPYPTPTPTRATGITGARKVFAVAWHLFILDANGALWRLSPSHVHPSLTPLPQRVPTSQKLIQISGGVGLGQDGTLSALDGAFFGIDDLGPENGGPVSGFGDITAVYNSLRHTVALRNDGTVWAWGQDPGCGLGDGTHSSSQIPVQLPGLAGVSRLSVNGSFNLALTEEGDVWYWGYRGSGGNQSRLCQLTPAPVPGIQDAVDISANWKALILTSDGDIFTFEPETLQVTLVPSAGGASSD